MLKRVRLYTPKAMLQQTWESFLLELKNLLEKYKIFGYIEDDEIAINAVKKSMNNLKVLDLEKLADEIIRVEYPTYEQAVPSMRNAILRRKQVIKIILEQYFKKWFPNVMEGVKSEPKTA